MRSSLLPNFSLKTTRFSLGLFILLVLSYFGTTITSGNVSAALSFPTNFSQPWGLFTYPLAVLGGGAGLANLILTLFLTMYFLTTVESQFGTVRTMLYYLGCMLAVAFFLTLGCRLLEVPFVLTAGTPVTLTLFGLYVGQHKRAQTGLFGSSYIQIEFILGLFTLLTYLPFLDFSKGPMIGLFAVLPVGLAYWFSDVFVKFRVGETSARTRVPTKKDLRPDSYFEEARRREKEREERERLRKLFESSLDEGDDR
jgi:membrane associated rhomboid family serine protease